MSDPTSFALRNVLIPSERDQTCIASDVVVQNGIISFVGPFSTSTANDDALVGIDDSSIRVFKDSEAMLVPGFFNGHTHSSEMWQRGLIKPNPLELWLCELIDYAPEDPEQIYYSAMLTAVETLLSGGTGLLDHLSVCPDERMTACIDAAVRAYKDVGIRAFVAPLVGDLDVSESIPSVNEVTSSPKRDEKKTDLFLRVMKDCVERHHDPDIGINMAVGPTGFQLCSDELFSGLAKIAEEHDLARHTHMLETKAQRMLAEQRYGKGGVIPHLQALGFLNSKTSLAHSVHLDEEDIAIVAKTKSTPVHCPLSNLRLGSGISPVLKMKNGGVNVGFGCDGPASEDGQDLLEAVKIGSFLHNVTDPDYKNWLTPHEAVRMASYGGAVGVGEEKRFGSVTVGKEADFCLYNLTAMCMLPRTDPVGLLIWGRPTGTLQDVWVRGRQLVRDGKCISVDTDKMRENLLRLQPKFQYMPRKSGLRDALEGKYRAAMGLPDSS